MAYNGHKNWNHWNVSLWLFNDEGLYRLVIDLVNDSATLDEAAIYILHALRHQGADYEGVVNIFKLPHTPDGAPYTRTSIRAALQGIR